MSFDYEALWHALPNPALVLTLSGQVHDLNGAAENFLGLSAKYLRSRSFIEMTGTESRVADLVGRAVSQGAVLNEYNVEFGWPDAPIRRVDLFAVPLPDEQILVLMHPRSNAERMGRQLTSRDAARSVAGMAAICRFIG